IDVPGRAALGDVPALHAAAPEAALVGFGVGDDQLGLACAEAGLTGFVGRDGTLSDLVDAVRRARAGELGCSPQLAALMCRRLAVLAGRPASTSLSPREREVARLVADGLSNKEIAQMLAIGPATVKNHVHNILDKLALRRRSAIAGRLQLL
uniref:response regulator transcription factor n=1 Tax=Sandarakinorhabdus oryzae TaxID=2675220 RepID=UPI0012E2A705